MSKNCMNCGQALLGNYCSSCGQSATIQRINSHSVYHDLQHGLFHVDGGFLYTLKALFTRPGYTVRAYLQGKRVKLFKPFSLVIILSAVYGLFYHFLQINLFTEASQKLKALPQAEMNQINEWLTGHFSWLNIFTILLTSMASVLIFSRHGYNFFEHLVLNAFISAQKLCIGIALLPLRKLVVEELDFYTWFILMLDYFLMIWTYLKFFEGKSFRLFIAATLVYILMITQFILIAALFLMIVGFYP